MAIQGNGFFVISNGGTQELTRAGNFQLSSLGTLTTTEGNNVIGYQAVNGKVSSGSPLGAMTLPIGETQAAHATGEFSLTSNLSSAAATGAQFSTSVTVYDSLGTSHNANVSFTKSGTNPMGLLRDAAQRRRNRHACQQHGHTHI